MYLRNKNSTMMLLSSTNIKTKLQIYKYSISNNENNNEKSISSKTYQQKYVYQEFGNMTSY